MTFPRIGEKVFFPKIYDPLMMMSMKIQVLFQDQLMNENSGLKDNVSSLSNRIEELQSTNQENADNISNYITKINQVEFKVS